MFYKGDEVAFSGLLICFEDPQPIGQHRGIVDYIHNGSVFVHTEFGAVHFDEDELRLVNRPFKTHIKVANNVY